VVVVRHRTGTVQTGLGIYRLSDDAEKREVRILKSRACRGERICVFSQPGTPEFDETGLGVDLKRVWRRSGVLVPEHCCLGVGVVWSRGHV
jgi:hypothetical protein